MKHPFYSLRKSRNILRHIYSLYRRKRTLLSSDLLRTLEEDLESLDKSILSRNREESSRLAQNLESFSKKHLKKTPFEYFKELFSALLIALLVATVIRQMCFEPMEIPTGSMRPTFKEQDRLIVSKTNFGVNIPLKAKHFFFKPSLVKRTGIVIFRPENMDMQNTDTSYFGIPGKKRYIKRCIGKPGDALYFYGGLIYGIDQNGNDLKILRESSWMASLEHIPFINFEGRATATAPNIQGLYSPVFYHQTSQLIGKQSLLSNRKILGEIYVNKEWKKESLSVHAAKTPQSYFDFWGIKNYATARLLTREEVEKKSYAQSDGLENATLYLELRHTPNLTSPSPKIIFDEYARLRPSLAYHTTVIPLKEEHLHAIMANLYTSRFIVKNQYAYRYSNNRKYDPTEYSAFPKLSGVADGCYEFYYGKCSSISWGGVSSPLSNDHPLYKYTKENIQNLFNLGIEFHKAFHPSNKDQPFFPSRFAYFRNGDLYLMGAPIIQKEDSTLLNFHQREKNLQQRYKTYIPFIDYGPPLKEDNTLDSDFIRSFGIKVPERMYLVLGDNHAASSDSRDFGFVPEENIRGSASFILWPPGKRWGQPSQIDSSWTTIPTLLVYSAILFIALLTYVFHKKRNSKPIFKKLH